MSSRILDMNENARGGRKERKPTMSTCQRGGGNQSKSNRHVPSNSGTPGAPRSSSRGGHRTRCIFPPIKPILYVNCVMESSDEEEIKTNTHSKQKVPSSLITPEESSSSSIGGDSPRSIFGPIKPIVYIDRIFESDEDEETINRKRTKIEEEIDELKENARALYLTSLADLQQNHPQANDYLHWDIEYPEEPILGGAKELLEGYTHEQACRFLAMMKVWATREWAELRELEEVNGHYAMFRVVNWNYNTFLAESCHTNLLKECKIIRINKEGLLRGDLIMVKELCRDHHGRWEARKIKLLERKDVEKDQKIVRTKKW
uniref:DUF5641 domain-containing protein n=1 Tax=Caenorhabditis tropicalis TaxID=1561998 RepID=A0A1I7UTT6_9PELO